MIVSAAQYILNETKDGNGTIIKANIDGTEMQVPIDPANRHYAEIMRQVDAGELTIAEAE
jgi:hypothetical protein